MEEGVDSDPSQSPVEQQDNSVQLTKTEKQARGPEIENAEVPSDNELMEIADRYKKFYGLPEAIVGRIEGTKILRLPEEDIVKLLKERISHQLIKIDEWFLDPNDKRDKEELSVIREKLLEDLKGDSILEDVRKSGGSFQISVEGERTIWVNTDRSLDPKTTLDHEILHNLSCDSVESLGLQNINYDGLTEWDPLNEAATEVLRIAEANPGLSARELFHKFKSGELEVSYQPYVESLLTLMALSDVENMPFTIDDLSQWYFGFGDAESIRGRGYMVSSLIPSYIGARGNGDSKQLANQLMAKLKQVT